MVFASSRKMRILTTPVRSSGATLCQYAALSFGIEQDRRGKCRDWAKGAFCKGLETLGLTPLSMSNLCCYHRRLSENGYFSQSLRQAQIIILEILQCIPVVIVFAFLDLGKNISFSDSLIVLKQTVQEKNQLFGK